MTTSDYVALRKAHVGIALGVNGTDVAREAADLVLADDSLNTIVSAIEQSRITHSNLQVLST
jgi:P-type E1-E2 ATPase